MDALDDLPGQARIRLLPVAPALDLAGGEALCAALDKLLRQFAREGRLERWALAVLGGGSVLAIATLGAEELSGCSQDKLSQLLAHHEHALKRQLVAAPPIVVEVEGHPRCVDRRTLRDLVAQGAITASSTHWDLRVTTLSAWRSSGRIAAGDSWLAGLLQAPPAAARS